MEEPQEKRAEQLDESQVVSRLWSYALTVLAPAAALRQAGLHRGQRFGLRPLPSDRGGLGRHFSRHYPFPVLQEGQPEEEASDEERLERLFEPLREVLFKEILREVQPLLRPDFRLLDPACGAGAEVIELAMLLIEGEAVAVCRSSRLLAAAFEAARERGVGSLACFQAGMESLPPEFAGAFDLVFSLRLLWLASSKPAALGVVFGALRPGGYALLADLAPPTLAFQPPDPERPRSEEEWSPQESGQELLAQMQSVGFSQAYWEELLPGIGLILGMK